MYENTIMACYSPLRGYRSKQRTDNGKRGIVFNRKDGYADQPVELPCGRCIGCRLEYARQWAMRCMHEASLHKDNSFITLTYNEENVPYGYTLVKKDYQDFMKRLRYHTRTKIRFYACGEYGEEDLRPHYHACLFGYWPKDARVLKVQDNGHKLFVSKELESIWGKGFAPFGAVTFESAGYCARYICKKITGDRSREAYWRVDEKTGVCHQVSPEFALMSRGGRNGPGGIGKGWIDKYGLEVYNADSVIINGREVLPPKYYDDQQPEEKIQKVKEERVRRMLSNPEERTMVRMRVREEVKKAQVGRLKRN